jgi:hypothetical protein
MRQFTLSAAVSPPAWALLIGAAIIMFTLLLIDLFIPAFDWLGR